MNRNFYDPDTASDKKTAGKNNFTGSTGFIISLLAICFCWAPLYGWIIWSMGMLCSLIGLIKAPREIAVAGILVSVLGLILLSLLATPLT